MNQSANRSNKGSHAVSAVIAKLLLSSILTQNNVSLQDRIAPTADKVSLKV